MKKIIALALVLLTVSFIGGCNFFNGSEVNSGKASIMPSTEDNLYYHVKEIWCENNGKKIYGKAYIPNSTADGNKRFPLVITSHGLGTNHEAGEDYCKEYAKNGFASYTFDFCGGSDEFNENKSDGDPLDMSIITEASDLEAVLNTAKSWDFVESDKIFLQGSSLGGVVTTIVGLKHQNAISGMILHYPAYNDHDVMHTLYDKYQDIEDVTLIDDYFWAGKRYVQDLWKFDVRKYLSEFKKSVLIIQGDCDDVVPLEVAEEANDSFPNSELVVIEGAEHGFGEEEFEQACESGIDFLTNTTSEATTQAVTQKATRDVNAEYDYEVKEIWCENNGNKIYGKAYIPKAEGKFPLVITSHGLGANHESGEGYCKEYAKKGFAGYTFDFCGGSNGNHENKSDGDSLDMSVMTEVSDLEAILDTAKTWEFVDTNYIFLQGGSQGGLVSAITGVRHKDEIAGMILHYPAFGMYDAMHRMFDSYDDIPDTATLGVGFTIGKQFAQDLWNYDVREHLGEFTKNVLIIQGDSDDIVSVASSENANSLFPHSELFVIEGAGHGFGGDDFTKASEKGIEYLFKNT